MALDELDPTLSTWAEHVSVQLLCTEFCNVTVWHSESSVLGQSSTGNLHCALKCKPLIQPDGSTVELSASVKVKVWKWKCESESVKVEVQTADPTRWLHCWVLRLSESVKVKEWKCKSESVKVKVRKWKCKPLIQQDVFTVELYVWSVKVKVQTADPTRWLHRWVLRLKCESKSVKVKVQNAGPTRWLHCWAFQHWNALVSPPTRPGGCIWNHSIVWLMVPDHWKPL